MTSNFGKQVSLRLGGARWLEAPFPAELNHLAGWAEACGPQTWAEQEIATAQGWGGAPRASGAGGLGRTCGDRRVPACCVARPAGTSEMRAPGRPLKKEGAAPRGP